MSSKSMGAEAHHSLNATRAIMRCVRSRILLVLGAALLTAAGHSQTSAYQQTNIISDGSVSASHTDGTLINPWGIAIGQQTPFWINSAGSGVSEVVNADGSKQFPVAVPPNMASSNHGRPTGIVFNPSGSSFMLPQNGAATFVFVTLDGTIAGWNANLTNAVTTADNSASHAIYTGLAIGARGAEPLLLVANTSQGRIDVFDSRFAPAMLTGKFADPNLPAGYVPYGIHTIGATVYVTYVLSPPAGGPPVTGSGLGYVNAYDMSGNFVARVASAGTLNAPWGVVQAPASFGAVGGNLLVGNFGDGTVSVFDAVSFAAKGQLQDSAGKAITNPGLWDLVFSGNGVGDPNALYFSAGINGEKGGLFGSITPAAAATGDFTLTTATSTLSVVAGQSTSMTISVMGTNSFKGPVTFSCSGLPAAAPCTFSPNPLTVGATVATTTMTINAAPRTGPGPYGFAASHPVLPGSGGGLLAVSLLPLGVGGMFLRRRFRGRAAFQLLAFVLMSSAILAAIGCSYTKPSVKPTAFPVTITATSGQLTHSTQITVTVN